MLGQLAAELCHPVLSYNHFSFGDTLYVQVNGTAMDVPIAPEWANIFMAYVELSAHL